MRCPCCDQETDKTAIICGGDLWLADGRVILSTRGVMKILEDLLRQGTLSAKSDKVMSAQVSVLRKLLRENRVPLGIVTRKKDGIYKLRRLGIDEEPPKTFELR
jgi:hypothetical protein